MRGGYKYEGEPFFIHENKKNVKASEIRKVLR